MERGRVLGGQQSNTKKSHGGRRHNKDRSHARTIDEVTLPTKARARRRKPSAEEGGPSLGATTHTKPRENTSFRTQPFPFRVSSHTTKELVIKRAVANVFQEGY